MAEVNDGDILRIGAVWTFEAVFQIVNVYHAQNFGGGDRTFAAAAIDVQEYMAQLYSRITALLSDDMDTDYITLANVTQDTTFGAIAWDAPIVGGDAGDVTAPGCCLFGFARTLKPRVQIRKYLGVFTETSMVNGLWVAALRTACGLLMSDHIAAFAGANGMTLKGVAYNRELDTYTFAISETTSAEPAYQRRRKRGRGS